MFSIDHHHHANLKCLLSCLHGLDGFLNGYFSPSSIFFVPDHDQSSEISNHYPQLGIMLIYENKEIHRWICCGSNFTFGSNFSNQFKIFKPV